jgi:fatty acid desaturase
VRTTIVAERLGAVSGADSTWRLAVMAAVAVASSATAIAVDHPAVWVLHALVGGIVLTACVAAEHEALHGSMFAPPAANHAVGAVVGALCWTPYSAYRTYHLRHHQKTHVEGDAEPVLVIRSRAMLLGLLAVSTLGLAAELWARLVRSLAGRSQPGEARLRRPALDVLSLAAGITFAAALVASAVVWGPVAVLVVYGGPFAVYLLLSALSFLPEHYECSYGPAPVVATTRTTTSTAVSRFVLWNANLHTAHHLVPSIPCHGLPRLHRLIEDDCEHLAPGYLGYYRGLWARLGRGALPAEPPWQR